MENKMTGHKASEFHMMSPEEAAKLPRLPMVEVTMNDLPADNKEAYKEGVLDEARIHRSIINSNPFSKFFYKVALWFLKKK